MTAFVMDCSITIAWCIEDEAQPSTDALMDVMRGHGAFAPLLWVHEVTNVFLQAEKRGRLTSSEVAARTNFIQKMPITLDFDASHRGFGEILALARAQKLTSYDATYLELAMRKSLPLATLDSALRNAATRLGLPTLPN